MIHTSNFRRSLPTALTWVFIFLIFTAVLPRETMAQGRTVTAANASYSAVSAAVAAAQAGDTVIVPPGQATWTGQLVITKSLSLIGAGAEKTVITSGIGNSNAYLIVYRPASFSTNLPFRVSGFTFNLANSSHGIFLDGTRNTSSVLQTKCRIDHNTFTGVRSRALWPQALHIGGIMGVVDNNLFDNFGYPVRNCWGPSGQSNIWWNNWNADLLGTSENMYFEDNTFTGVEIIMDCQYGNRYAIRYNTVTTWTGSYPLLDIHGNHSMGDQYSSFGGEVYGNQINDNSGMRLMDHRGGKLLLFMNNSTTPSWHIQVRDEAPESSNPTTNPEPQYPNESYFFLNRRNLTGSAPTISNEGPWSDNPPLTRVPKENREYWNGNPSFNGTVGVGWGTLANRPTTCTVGVGYWATDQSTTNLTGMVGKNPGTPIAGTLYVCKATNVWTAFYKPYTYPHPLRSESPAPAATITASSPNGGESWVAGSSHHITWTTTGTVGNVKIEYSTNSGTDYSSIIASTANTGSYAWTVPNSPSAVCHVRVSQVSTGTPVDTSNAAFSISAAAIPSAITVASPNGGENWAAGTSHNIAWSTTGTVGNVKIEYSTNAGSTYSSVITSTSNSGNYTWTVPNTPSTTCLVRVSQASTGTPIDASNSNFTIASPATAMISLSRNSLTFGASTGGTKTPHQTVLVNNMGQGTLTWTVEGSGSPYFLQISPSQGTGNGIIQVGINATGLLKGTYTGYVKVYSSGVTNPSQTITVKLKVHDQGTTTAPFGAVDTPLDVSTVRSSVPVTGWVLDDIAVQSVKIYREPLAGEQGGSNGLAYIGDAIFVDGARNDIPDIYPDYPQNFRAGWGYMMLTNILPPNQGNGTYRLHAVGLDMEGFEVDLGTKTIYCDNAHAVKPFGTIDTPSPGGTASGTNFNNFGWALTPAPNTIPINGSTITVWVDGEPLGHPLYGSYRSDIASLFPGLMNSNLSAGVFTLNTTQYLNGVHTIAWGVTDSSGNVDGLGSRFFNILNTGTAQGLNGVLADESTGSQSFDVLMKRPVNSQRLSVRKGLGTSPDREILTPDNFGTILVEIKETERFEVDLGIASDLKGGLIVDGKLKPLPIGSRLNSNKGTFSWMPAAGFLGEYDLMFLKEEAGGRTTRIPVKISIQPKFSK